MSILRVNWGYTIDFIYNTFGMFFFLRNRGCLLCLRLYRVVLIAFYSDIDVYIEVYMGSTLIKVLKTCEHY